MTMFKRVSVFAAGCLLLAAGAALGQGAPATAKGLTFDVATVRMSAPLDMAKLQADAQAGRMPNFGAHLDGLRAEYNYMSLHDLIVYAYKLKPVQVDGPDWMKTERFDIVARLPEGSSKDDAPAMLRALLEDRFKLAAHLESKDLPVFALVVGKGGPKLTDSPANPPIDENAELKPGETKVDLPDGPARITRDLKTGAGATVNMGTRGIYTQTINLQTQTIHTEGKGVSMAGFIDLLNQVMQIGGSSAKQLVDQTGLTGHYEVSLDLSLADLMAAARAQGIDMPGAPPPPPGGGAGEASDPGGGGGGSTVTHSLEKLGLKLEPTKAPVQQLVVDHIEKTPTEN
jgi:uncharacterized protein (TIGR03435 family)